jgi:MFS transporter, BCD family, chlorophyll transporter
VLNAGARRWHQRWLRLDARFLPFADAASAGLTLPRLLRLALFQVSVGLCAVLLTGTLNRVMIVELGIAASLVATLVALPLLFAPLRALLGFRSDRHRSALGWRRVPFLWLGTMLQFGGLAIMPFALIVLSGDSNGPAWIGICSAALAFVLVGAGMHVTQTAGLALATDVADPDTRPRVVALLYVMLLFGTLLSALAVGALLQDFSALRLIQVLQGASLLVLALNTVAIWKQEGRTDGALAAREAPTDFSAAWNSFIREARPHRYLAALATGTAAFAMQDALLEPYGAVALGLGVSATTALTALLAAGMLLACVIAAHALRRHAEPLRIAAAGCLIGLGAFASIVFAAPLQSVPLFAGGAALVGLGSGMFALGMLTIAMGLQPKARSGLALGTWGAVQATAAGLAILLGGLIADAVDGLAQGGALGPGLIDPGVGYATVYHLEIALLFVTLALLGPLLSWRQQLSGHARAARAAEPGFGIPQFPG